jgi:hypothetical protein
MQQQELLLQMDGCPPIARIWQVIGCTSLWMWFDVAAAPLLEVATDLVSTLAYIIS